MLTREEVIEAVGSVGSRLLLADALKPTLYIDDAPVRSGPYAVEASDSEPAVMFSCFVREPFSDRDLGRTVRLSVELAGIVFDAYIGRIVFVRERSGGAEIECQTPAYEWQRTPVGTDQEWTNTPATVVIYSALSALSQIYRYIEIPPSVAEPPVTARGGDRVGAFDYIADAVELTTGDSDARLRRVFDTALSVATAYPETPVSGEPVWTVREGEDCDYGAVEVEQVDGERYASVAVMRRTEEGKTEELARVGVENGDAAVNPASCLVLEYSDQQPGETTAERGGVVLSARATAFNEAMRRDQNARKLSVPVSYHPYWLERGDVVGVVKRLFTGQFPEDTGERGSVVTTYLGRVIGYTWGEGRAEANLILEGAVVSEVFAPEAARAPTDSERLDTPNSRALWGITYDGQQYVDTNLPWVRVLGEDTLLDVEIAALNGVKIERLTDGVVRVRETV